MCRRSGRRTERSREGERKRSAVLADLRDADKKLRNRDPLEPLKLPAPEL